MGWVGGVGSSLIPRTLFATRLVLSGKLLLGGGETFHVLRRTQHQQTQLGSGPAPARGSPDWLLGGGGGPHLLIALQVPELLDLKQVSLHREERHLGVPQDGRRDGGQFQAVLLQPQHLQTGTRRHLSHQDGDLQVGQQRLAAVSRHLVISPGSRTGATGCKRTAKHGNALQERNAANSRKQNGRSAPGH